MLKPLHAPLGASGSASHSQQGKLRHGAQQGGVRDSRAVQHEAERLPHARGWGPVPARSSGKRPPKCRML